MSRRGALRRLRGGDEGSTLVLVVGTMVVLSLVLLTTLGYVVRSQKYARNDQDQASAMSAAQSGVEELLSRLNANSAYGTTLDCANTALQGPTVTGGSACGWGSTTAVGWVPVVPGSADPKAAAFHYSLDLSTRLAQGRITVTSTGRANGVYQTVQAIVGEQGASDYVYYTDFESADPTNTAVYPSSWSGYSSAAKTACGGNGYDKAYHWWGDSSGHARSDYSCKEITFIGGDVIDGKVFTNDTIWGSASGGVKPSFLSQVTTANPSCVKLGATNSDWEQKCLRSGSVANFNSIAPQYHAPDYLSDTSDAFAAYPGCHYVGATRIIFSGTQMKVWNRSSVNGGTAPVAVAKPGGSAPSCGTGTDINGQTVAIPSSLVVYVGDSTKATPGACSNGQIDGTLPLANDVTMSTANKRCEKGNLYVEGAYDGQVTLATSQSIVVTGDLVRSGGPSGDDFLGLVAQNSVEIFHPVTYYGDEIDSWTWPHRIADPATGNLNPAAGIQVAAAIQTLQHSFYVQEYDEGYGGGKKLYVSGSIAQRWRGAVGTGSGSTGYLKNYTYDQRLTYVLPPYLPRWKDSRWSLRSSGEIPTPGDLKG